MIRLLTTWAGNVVALFVAAWLVDGVSYGDEGWTLVVAGLVFTLANRIVKPVVTILAIPLIVITLGLGYVLVNLLMLYVTDWVVGGFELRTFGAALLATLVVALTNAVLH